MVLGGAARWTGDVAAKDVEVEVGGCALRLAPAPGAARLLSEESGSLGGIVPPSNVAVDCEGFVWLLGRTSALLRRFDPCTCSFVTVPCTAGRGGDKRAVTDPAGIAAADSNLFVCDAGPPGRLLIFDRRSFALRSVWAPPAGATAQPWSPRSVVVDGPTVYVGDPANGAIHRFARWGGWLGMWEGFGAISALALDCSRRLYVIVAGAPKIIQLNRAGQAVGLVATPMEVIGDFPVLPFRVAADGTIDLCSICDKDPTFKRAGEPKCLVATSNPACDKDRAFDRNGEPVCFPAIPNPAFALTGTWTSGALDSRIAGCVWHRIECDAATAEHQRIGLATYTAEVPVPDVDIALLPDNAWVNLPPAAPGQDALILSPPGRYLWLKIRLEGDGQESPRLCSATIEYPRISLRRYLPAAFGSDPVSADFADRLLTIFDRGFRQIEERIDNEAMLFDADSAPADPDADVLAWLGAWLGLNLERSWPERARRAALKAASRAFACRGTVRGLREILLGWLGWSDFPVIRRRPSCGPRCRPTARAPDKPYLILEHWKLRRWLWLGKGKLGSDAVLWGEKLLGRSQLNATARLDATRLDTTSNPLTDPFAIAANRFSVFLPARYVTDARRKGQVRRLVDEQSPAGVLSNIVAVHARMRIGVQASIGFDSVVGCWPSGITMDEARLGRGTVLSGTNPGGVTARIGRTARLQPAPGRAAVRREQFA
jgi:phage tail-like protein